MSTSRSYYADATLGDFLRDLWRARLFILLGVLVGGIAGFMINANAVAQYEAAMVIAPLEGRPDSQPHDFARFETILRGGSVAAILMNDPILMAGLGGDKRWRSAAAPPLGNASFLTAFLREEIKIMPVGDSPLRRVSYDHPDPAFAPLFLKRLYAAADHVIRQERKADAAKRINHFTETLAITDDPQQRRSLTDNIRAEEEKAVLMESDQPYAATLAEPPVAEVEPDWPRPFLIYPVLMLGGAFLGFAVFSLRRSAAAPA